MNNQVAGDIVDYCGLGAEGGLTCFESESSVIGPYSAGTLIKICFVTTGKSNIQWIEIPATYLFFDNPNVPY